MPWITTLIARIFLNQPFLDTFSNVQMLLVMDFSCLTQLRQITTCIILQ
uniref:Uncharacterized protein n=1 Tax=Podoviridae sp. ctpVv1 TaxID=2827748 RepID=A0A8S5T2W0_9CAUD|nr:MAG TPA: hypothetical protein [Podoviridae sp. ctpVv1]